MSVILANPKVSLSSYDVKQGDTVNVIGTGFTPGGVVNYEWPSINFIELLIADNKGNLAFTFTIDQNRAPGSYEVDFTDVLTGQVVHLTIFVFANTSAPPPPVTPPGPLTGPFAVFNPLLIAVENFITSVINFDTFVIQPITKFVINSIINPFNDFFNTLITDAKNITDKLQDIGIQISSDVTGAIKPITDGVSVIINDVTNTVIVPVLNSIIDDVTTVKTTLNDISTSILGDVNAGITGIKTTIQNISDVIIGNITTTVQNIPGQVQSVLTNTLKDIKDDVTNASNVLSDLMSNTLNTLSSGIQTIDSDINAFKTNFSNAFESLSTSFNEFNTAINTGFTDTVQQLGNFGNQVLTAINDTVQHDVKPSLDMISNIFTQQLQSLIAFVTRFTTTKTSDDPQIALNNLLIEVGEIITGITATFGILTVLDNLHPFHELHISENFKSILEFIGVYDLSRETLKLFVDNGIGLQAEYAVNFEFQARKIPKETAQKAVWYGVENVQDYKNDLQFEGYEPLARDRMSKVLYKPLPTFILSKLIELQMIDSNLATQQLLQEGFDPQNLPGLIQAFDNLGLQSFQNTLRSAIYTQFKDGFINTDKAKEIMTTFAIPPSQQDWILFTALQEYSYETRLLYSTQILDEFKKGVIKVDEAQADLLALGMSSERVKQKLAIAAVSNLPSLSKNDKQVFFDSLVTLGILVQ
jgi:archaellum component FlaC